MALVIGIISQKGGVGKSTLSRLLAVEYARNEYNVKIADMDLSQGTVSEWNRVRMSRDFTPLISVEQFNSVSEAMKQGKNYDLIVFDGAPHATRMTLDIAQRSDFIIMPTGVTLDDLRPTIRLAHELVSKGISAQKIGIILSRVGASQNEINGAKRYITEGGYFVLGVIPEKTSIGQSHDIGKAANETAFKTINDNVDELIQAIVNRISEING
ncbi:MAG: ParA family protein [Saprospiraceae bacterium]|nr:ParA family protein [Saprospiraceae bacterium]